MAATSARCTSSPLSSSSASVVPSRSAPVVASRTTRPMCAVAVVQPDAQRLVGAHRAPGADRERGRVPVGLDVRRRRPPAARHAACCAVPAIASSTNAALMKLRTCSRTGARVDRRRRRRGAAARRPARCSWSRTWPGSRRSRRARCAGRAAGGRRALAPAHAPAAELGRDRRADLGDRRRAARCSSSSASKRGGGRVQLVRAVLGHRAVEPHQHVQVHEAAPLVLGDLDVGRADLALERVLRHPGAPRQRAREVDRRVAPQLAERVVPDHRRARSRSSPGTAARPGTRRPRRASRLHDSGRPCGQTGASRRGRQRRGSPSGPSARVCTAPKLGAVSVTNTAGCSADRCPGRPCRPAGRRRSGGRRPGGSAPRTAGRRPRGGSRTPCAARRRARRRSTTRAGGRAASQVSIGPRSRTGRAQ